jgi:FAD/FMN-containing dehydrogenase
MEKEELVRNLNVIVSKGNVVQGSKGLLAYEYNASLNRGIPDAVVFAAGTGQVSELVKLAHL